MILTVIGDSISAGTMTSPAGVYTAHNGTEYPWLLAGLLRKAGTPVDLYNLAIPGAVVPDMIAQEVPLIPARTNVAIIYAGTNDTAFSPGLQINPRIGQLASAVKAAAPGVKLCWITVRQYFDFGTIRSWNDTIRAYVVANGGALLDLEGNQKTASDWYPSPYVSSEWADGVHPTPVAAARIASRLLPMILSLAR